MSMMIALTKASVGILFTFDEKVAVGSVGSDLWPDMNYPSSTIVSRTWI
jgi:hypothetical protein